MEQEKIISDKKNQEENEEGLLKELKNKSLEELNKEVQLFIEEELPIEQRKYLYSDEVKEDVVNLFWTKKYGIKNIDFIENPELKLKFKIMTESILENLDVNRTIRKLIRTKEAREILATPYTEIGKQIFDYIIEKGIDINDFNVKEFDIEEVLSKNLGIPKEKVEELLNEAEEKDYELIEYIDAALDYAELLISDVKSEAEKKDFPDIIEKGIKWALENKVNRFSLIDMDLFLKDNKIQLSEENKRRLYLKINASLKRQY